MTRQNTRDTILLCGETYLISDNPAILGLLELINLAIQETSEAAVREQTHYIRCPRIVDIHMSALDFLADPPQTDDDWPINVHHRVRDGCVELLAEVYRRNPEKKHLQKYNRMAFENDLNI